MNNFSQKWVRGTLYNGHEEVNGYKKRDELAHKTHGTHNKILNNVDYVWCLTTSDFTFIAIIKTVRNSITFFRNIHTSTTSQAFELIAMERARKLIWSVCVCRRLKRINKSESIIAKKIYVSQNENGYLQKWPNMWMFMQWLNCGIE